MTIIFKRILPEIIREGNSGSAANSLYNIENIDWANAVVFLDYEPEQFQSSLAGPEPTTSITPAP